MLVLKDGLPKGVIVNGDGTASLEKGNAEIESFMDLNHTRYYQQMRWLLRKQPSILAKIKEFVTAVTSGEASEETVSLRKESCFGGNGKPQCVNLIKSGDSSYCGACSCGKWLLADLNGPLPKLRWKKLDCPLKRPGFSNGGTT